MVRQRSATPLPPVRIRVAPLSPDFIVRTFFVNKTQRSFCVGKRTEKRIDESEKDGILIEVEYGAMAKW